MPAIGQVVIINDFSSANGGSAAIALQAARQYRRLGLPVTYICGDAANPELERIGVSTVALNSGPLLELSRLEAMRKGINNSAAEAIISNWIRRHDTANTVYHLHSWAQILSSAVFRALRPVEDRLIVTCHDFFNVCPNGGFTNFQKSAPCDLRPLSLPCLVTNCDRRSYLQKGWRVARQVKLNHTADFASSAATFTFLHERMRSRFVAAGFPAKNLATVPNPVEPWSKTRIAAEDNEGFLFVGRIGRDKGADLAIGAAERSGQELILAGTGELADEQSTSHEGIKFAGWLGSQEIASLARKARALIVPSRVVEPFGLVILEAAMSGLPVIVASHAYLAEDVMRIGCGRAFDIAEPQQLASMMASLAEDDDAIERMSKAGYAQAGSLGLTSARWLEAFVELFENKLG
ncbi:glycosyltransferase family 4 protein [Altererythrobacter sp. BO-6]|uniref:glycosyltransferase family 4 protein n=1 Tax=Altererythrobacter sp. BO-6 TaxID=2604537 RepID=UPI0013E18D3C|nr:glycosyltransferase family 4 protein [Altererythrobacter sp. BO-6]QIG53190.1 glycosyltransferase family 4 protein [Altererythrobacter sp. BO-6]